MVKGCKHIDDSVAGELPRIPGVLLPASAVDGFDAVLDAVHTEFVSAQADNLSMLLVSRVCDGIVPTPESLVQNPTITKERNRPVC